MTARRVSVGQRFSHEIYGGTRAWFWLLVYPGVDEMRRAATRYSGGVSFDGALGCFHPAPERYEYGEDGDALPRGSRSFSGVMRLVSGRCQTDVVAHEATHAAAAIYRRNVEAEVNLGDDCDEREERLAYVVGDLVGALSTAMHEIGEWT